MFLKIMRSFLKKFFNQFIKFSELYKLFEKHLKGHIQIVNVKCVAMSPYLFCSINSRVPAVVLVCVRTKFSTSTTTDGGARVAPLLRSRNANEPTVSNI